MNPAGLAPSHPSDPESAFDRDTFLLRQKALSISEKYTVSDETGAAVLHVVRPAMALRNIAALLAALVGVLLSFVVAAAAAFGLVADRSPLQPIVFIVVLVAGIVGSVMLAVVLSPKRHVRFMTEPTAKAAVLEVKQDQKLALLNPTYTVLDREGRRLALFKKNMIHNLFRKRWQIFDGDGALIALAREDSWFKAFARRFVGPLMGFLRTNFVIETPDGTHLGTFNRQFTILDRYVLDMSNDRQRHLDRRVAIALGVMLDTGEKR